MFIKILDTIINMEKVQYMKPYEIEGGWTIRIQFDSSGFLHLGEYKRASDVDFLLKHPHKIAWSEELSDKTSEGDRPIYKVEKVLL